MSYRLESNTFHNVRFILLLLLSSLPASADSSTAVLGRIGDTEITTAEVRELLSGLEGNGSANVTRDPAALGQFVRALLVQRKVLELAETEKWDEQPAVIAALVRARETALTESFLQSRSAPDPGFPDEAAIQAAYAATKDQLLIPRSYQLAQIFIAADHTKLNRVVKQLAEPKADFSAIARAESEEPTSAARGGEIGWLTEDQIQPEIRPHLTQLRLQTVSDPISLKDGWHLIKILNIREAHSPALPQVRDALITQLRAESVRRKHQEFLDSLLRENPAAINETELRKLTTPVVPAASR